MFFTVLDKISPNAMGLTLAHEHLSANCEFFFVDPPKGIDKAQMKIENLDFIQNYP